MKKTVILLALFIITAAAAGCTFTAKTLSADTQGAPEAIEGGSEEKADLLPEESMLAPEQLRDGILYPAIAFHPGTAGSTLGSAQSAAGILAFCTEHQLRLEDQEKLGQTMEDAYAMLSDEEKDWLQENIPILTGLADSVFTDYDGVKNRFEDAGADGLISDALAGEHAQEDWAQAETALTGLIR